MWGPPPQPAFGFDYGIAPERSTRFKRKSSLTEELTISCYGVGIRIVDATGAELCRRLPCALAPEFAVVAGAAGPVSYLVTTLGTEPTAEHPGYRVTRDGS